MISVVVILSLLSFPATTGLQCAMCYISNHHTCRGVSIPCPANYTCGSECKVEKNELRITEFLTRGCVHVSHCGFRGSTTTIDQVTQRSVSCGNQDHCSLNFYTIQQANGRLRKPNGLFCTSCSSVDPWCDGRAPAQCRGDENMCYHRYRNITASPHRTWARMGCTTEPECDRNQTTVYDFYKETVICTKASQTR